IGLGLGRIGNFINGELFGRPTNVVWAMIFPEGGGMPRHPSQIYEALLEGLVLFLILRWFYKKNFYPGTVFWALVAFYGLFLFLFWQRIEPSIEFDIAIGDKNVTGLYRLVLTDVEINDRALSRNTTVYRADAHTSDAGLYVGSGETGAVAQQYGLGRDDCSFYPAGGRHQRTEGS